MASLGLLFDAGYPVAARSKGDLEDVSEEVDSERAIVTERYPGDLFD